MKIEKNIPMPKTFPFDQMEPGDSFAIPNEIARNRVSVAAYRHSKINKTKFSVKMMPDGTIRCWRTK
jgi:hypothetical protein